MEKPDSYAYAFKARSYIIITWARSDRFALGHDPFNNFSVEHAVYFGFSMQTVHLIKRSV